MDKNKYYKTLYIFSLCLFIAAVLVHLTGYVTNVLYIVAWILWMPVIGLAVVTVFDYKNTKTISKDSFKSFYFYIVVISAVYVVFNLVYGFYILGSVSDIVTIDNVHYAVDSNNNKTEIGYNEYVRYSLASFRLLSGHMLVFIAAPMWYFKEKLQHKK